MIRGFGRQRLFQGFRISLCEGHGQGWRVCRMSMTCHPREIHPCGARGLFPTGIRGGLPSSSRWTRHEADPPLGEVTKSISGKETTGRRAIILLTTIRPGCMGEEEEEKGTCRTWPTGSSKILSTGWSGSRARSLFELWRPGHPLQGRYYRQFSPGSPRITPALAAALTARSGSHRGPYGLLSEGEGSSPRDHPDLLDCPGRAGCGYPRQMDDEMAGKWLIFLQDDRVDGIWRKHRNATASGEWDSRPRSRQRSRTPSPVTNGR